jgi:hypothetical protein
MDDKTPRDWPQITRENRSRRAAARQNLKLSKVRRMDKRAADYGTWTLATARGRVLVRGDLDAIEHYLDGDQPAGPGEQPA